MDNCKDYEHKIAEYVDGTLNHAEHQEVKQHIDDCEDCRKIEKEYRFLFKMIDGDTGEHPSKDQIQAVKSAIESEEFVSQRSSSRRMIVLKIRPQSIYKAAAILVLMLSSYWLGNYNSEKNHIPELADLKTQKEELKRIVALSLFESESASKRIQAVKYSEELGNPDNEILQALIHEMLYDKLVNVRLASARALEKFSKYELVKNGFIQALKTEENASMQIELIQILVQIKERKVIPKIRELIDSDDTPSDMKNQLQSELQNLI